MKNIEAGDTVKHKTETLLSGGRPINVLSVNGDEVVCEYFDENLTHKQYPFNISDLEIIHKVSHG